MALQASHGAPGRAPWRGLGRLGYLSAGGRTAKFVVDAGCSLQMGSRMSAADQPLALLRA